MHTHPPSRRWAFQTAIILTAIAALLYCSWPLGFWLNPVAQKTGLASELGASGQPYNWLFIGADVVSGVLLVAACGILFWVTRAHGSQKALLVLLALYGICGAIDASLPIGCLPSLQVCGAIWRDPVLIVHGIVDITGSLALIGTLLTAWMNARRHCRQWLPWIYGIGGGGVVFALLSLIFILCNGPGYWAQRYYITLSCIWVASIPYMLYRQALIGRE